MITVLLTGILIGVCVTGIPLAMNLYEKHKIEQNIEEIYVDLEDHLEEIEKGYLKDEQYKIKVKNPQNIEDKLVDYAKQKIDNKYIVGSHQEIYIKQVSINPEGTSIIFEITSSE